MKSWEAGYRSASVAVRPTSSGGQSSEYNRWTCSPSTRRASRLVAMMWAWGASLTTRSASAATTPITCSQLSSTRRTFLSPIKAGRLASGSWVCTMNPSADATVAGTSLASVTAARSTKKTAPLKPSNSMWATDIATVVFPMPPGPTILTNLAIISRADKVRMVSSRPIIRVNLGGNLWSQSETATSLGEDCDVESVTGATKQYPRPDTVAM